MEIISQEQNDYNSHTPWYNIPLILREKSEFPLPDAFPNFTITPKPIPKVRPLSVYSSPILASSLSPQSVVLGLVKGRSSSPSDCRLMLLFLLPLSNLSFLRLLFLLLSLPLLLLLKLASSRSEYSGGGLLDLEPENDESRVWAEFESRLADAWVGVGEGVISVLEVISTSSASRYHFLRRVYLPHPSWPRRPFCHCRMLALHVKGK